MTQFKANLRPGIEQFSDRTFLPLLTSTIIYVIIMTYPSRQLADSDTLWHIVLGQRIWEDLRLPQHDEFSYTFNGAPYQTNSWLSDVLLGGAYNIGGFAGVTLLSSFCFALTFFLLQRDYLRTVSNKISIYFCCAILLLLISHLYSRPHVLAFPAVAVWAIVLMDAEEKNDAPPLRALLIFFLWTNLHGSFLLGFVVIFPVFLQSLFRTGQKERKEKIRSWVIFIAGMLLMTVIGPYGVNPLRTAFSVLGLGPLLQSAQEWMSRDFAKFDKFEAVLLVTIGTCVYGGVKMSLARTAILMGLLHMALAHVRNADYLAIFGSASLAMPIGQAFGGRDLPINAKRLLPFALAIAIAETFSAFYFRSVVPPANAYPFKAFQAARANGVHGRVLNESGAGGTLIFHGEKVFIDARWEFYPRAFLEDYLNLFKKPDVEHLNKILENNCIQWTLMGKNQPLAEVINKLPGWVEVYRDEIAVVHKRLDRSPSER